ncbi:hypothetical protein ACHAQJ_005122, partial [Trichoderma viride]
MKFVALSSIVFVLATAMGVVAVPANPDSQMVEARAENSDAGSDITYYGTCTQKTGQCRYKGQTGKLTICKCPKGCSGN